MLTSKFIWDEMEKVNRSLIREGWKCRLPSEYDIYCFDALATSVAELHIPGNCYIYGYVDCHNLIVDGDLIVDGNGNIDCYDLNVGGNLIMQRGILFASDITVSGDVDIRGSVFCHDLNVAGKTSISRNLSCQNLTATDDFIVGKRICSKTIHVNGLFSCYDVNTNFHRIFANDFVCELCEKMTKRK